MKNAVDAGLKGPTPEPYIRGMTKPIHTRTFMSGNSVAVRLPKGTGFGVGVDLRIEREPDGRLVLTPVLDRAAQLRDIDRVHQAMLKIGAPADGVQARDPFTFVERPGLE